MSDNFKEPTPHIFISLYWEWFCNFVKGNFSVAILLLGVIVFVSFGVDYGVKYSVATVLIGSVVAFYRIWANERRKVILLNKEIDQLMDRVSRRNKIGEFLDEGKKLQIRCGGEPENPELIDLATNWGTRTSTYLRSIEKSFGSLFDAPERTNIPDSVWANRGAYSYIDPRLGVLRLLLNRLM